MSLWANGINFLIDTVMTKTEIQYQDSLTGSHSLIFHTMKVFAYDLLD